MNRGDADLQVVIGEVGHLMAVFAAHLTDSLHQASREVAAVGAAFDDVAAANDRIKAVALREPDMSLLRIDCDRIGRSLSAAVVGLQCHDRMAQRLGHIRDSLEQLQSLFGDGNMRARAEWLELLRNVALAHQTEQSRLAAGGSTVSAMVELF